MDLFSCLSQFLFCSFSSGSSGNCYYVGTTSRGVLVDMGITLLKLEKSLDRIGLTLNDIECVFVTHDHIDHIKGLEPLLKKKPIKVYASSECAEKLCEACGDMAECIVVMPQEVPFKLSNLSVTSFPVSHDAVGSVGYFIEHQAKSLTIATDCGELDEVVKSYLNRATSIVLEANYDKKMLLQGTYPYMLKQRIMNGKGHLSNYEAVDFVTNNYKKPYENIMFCHLSSNNNKPELLMKQFYQGLRRKQLVANTNVTVFPLPRTKQSHIVYL